VHAHEHEEVLTYVTEGFASYGLEGGPTDSIPQHSARLLTAPSRASHRVSPAEGAIIRWFNLVVDLPETVTGSPQLQSAGPGVPYVEMDTVRIRPLVGPRATMRSVAGLECEEMVFVQESTTFPRVGEDRRAILYALAGEGSVDQQTVSAGEAALIEGQTAVGVRGARGFRAIFASAPKVEGN
jgi:redox-sensitive bicupin YhaK (pirin superfamily)